MVDINLPRDKESGKTKGFGFLMYEDQRSTVLAVDNMNGAQVLGRTIRVDHCKKYKQAGTKNEAGEHIEPEEPSYNVMPPLLEGQGPSSLEHSLVLITDSGDESSDSEPADDLDEDDPMAAFIRAEKKKEKAQRKAITSGKGDHEGETKEERRARREAKRARKEERERRRRNKEYQAGSKRQRSENSPRRGTEREVRDGRGENGAGRERSRERDAERRRNGHENERFRGPPSSSREDRYRDSGRTGQRSDARDGRRSPARDSRDRYRDREDARYNDRDHPRWDSRRSYEDDSGAGRRTH